MQVYEESIEAKEDAGTPGILQAVRCGLVFKLKERVGCQRIEELEQGLGKVALELWSKCPNIVLMGADRKGYMDHDMRVSIISFNILAPKAMSINGFNLPAAFKGRLLLHPHFIIQILNDVYGIQVSD
jgi:selenocysteine lyase/cysteine desulfurase